MNGSVSDLLCVLRHHFMLLPLAQCSGSDIRKPEGKKCTCFCCVCFPLRTSHSFCYINNFADLAHRMRLIFHILQQLCFREKSNHKTVKVRRNDTELLEALLSRKGFVIIIIFIKLCTYYSDMAYL